jgi:autotransporter-associated beta strand protein
MFTHLRKELTMRIFSEQYTDMIKTRALTSGFIKVLFSSMHGQFGFRKRAKRAQSPQRRLRVECLESRAMLASWTQGALPADTSWTNAGNYSTNQAPTATTAVLFNRHLANDTATDASGIIKSLTVSKTDLITNDVNLSVADAANLTINDFTSVTAGVLRINGGVGSAVQSKGYNFGNDTIYSAKIAASKDGNDQLIPSASVNLSTINWTIQKDLVIGGTSYASRLYIGTGGVSLYDPALDSLGTIQVLSHGYLEGSNSVGGKVETQSGGSIEPGNTISSVGSDVPAVGTLHADRISFHSGSTLSIDIGGTGNDSISSSGDIDFFTGSTIHIHQRNGWTPNINSAYAIATASGSIDFHGTLNSGTDAKPTNLAGRGLFWHSIVIGQTLYIFASSVQSAATTPLIFVAGAAPTSPIEVATIDGLTSNQMSSVTAMVVWGDGSAPTILANNQLTPAGGTSLEVDVSHTYYTNGITCRYAIATTFYTDDNYDTPIATVDSLAEVNGSNSASLGPVSPTTCPEFEDLAASTGLEITLGRLFDGSVGYSNSPGAVLATFTDAAGPLSYSGTVQWETVNGVGQNTIATILPITGTADYRVFGDYTFLAVGNGIKSAVVTLRASDNAATSITVPIAVGDELSITPLPVDLEELNEGCFVEVARFTDSDPAAVEADYQASMTGLSASQMVIVADSMIAGDFQVYAQLDSPYTGSTTPITTTVQRIDDASSASATVANALLVDGDDYAVLDALPSGGELVNNGVLVLDGATDYASSIVISGSGSLIQRGTNTVTLSGCNTDYTGTLTIANGTLVVGDAYALGSGAASLVVDGGTVNLNNFVVALSSVFIAEGTIDLGTGAIVVNTSAFGFVPQGDQYNEYLVNGADNAEYGYAAFHDAILEGANYCNNGFWNGTRGILSSYAANWPNQDMGIGWVDNAYADYASWRSVALNSGKTLVSLTWYGDADLNGAVNNDDSGIWSGYMTSGITFYGGPPEWVDADWNGDGVVDTDDIGMWSGTLTLGDGYDLGFVVILVTP